MMLFELALLWGYTHPRHLVKEMTSQDISDWLAFSLVRPFGYLREAEMFGTLAAQQYNMNKAKGRNKGWMDFFPSSRVMKDEQGKDDPERIIELFKHYNATHAASFKKQPKKPKAWKLKQQQQQKGKA